MSTVNLKNKTIVVTGAAGFIGAALCRRLLSEQEAAAVIGIDNMSDSYDVSLKEYRLERLQADDGFTFIKGDIADQSFIKSVFEQYRPELVVHLAAQAGIRNSITNPVSCVESNIVGFLNILEGCRACLPEHLIYASSSSVYGDDLEVPYTTDDRTDSPVSLYAATKKSDEVMAYAYSKLYDIPTTGLRFFTVYGPEGRPDMAYFSFTDKLRAGQKIQLYNYGKCARDFTYIDDLTEGLFRVMRKSPESKDAEDGRVNPPYALYNIGSQRPKEMTDVVDILQQELVRAGLLPSDFDLQEYEELLPMQPGDVTVTCADTTSFAREFGFQPNTSLRTGLRKFAEWYKQYYMS